MLVPVPHNPGIERIILLVHGCTSQYCIAPRCHKIPVLIIICVYKYGEYNVIYYTTSMVEGEKTVFMVST